MNDLKMKLVLEAVDNASGELKKVDGQVSTLGATASKIGPALKLLGATLAGFAVGKLAAEFISVNAEFQKLEASLVTVTGSAEAAQAQFSEIKEFAATTPYQLAEVTEAFIKMKALGLDASADSLRSYGNTASAMGKSLNQMIEAVADAATGEFERLKEFGIKASQQGDTVSLTFRGVTTQIGNDAASITAYLKQIGDVDFAGGMDRQMKTLGGSLSNLSDEWDKFLNALGEDTGAADAAAGAINRLADAMGNFSNALRLAKELKEGNVGFFEWMFASPEDAEKLLKNIDAQDRKLLELQNTVKEFKRLKQGNFWWTARDEQEMQQAIKALEFYKLEMGDVARLKNAATHIAAQPAAAAVPAKTSWTDKELSEAVKSAQGISDAWQQMHEDRWEVKSRALDVEIQMEREAAEQSRQAWQATSDSWLSKDQGAADYQQNLLERFEALQQSLLSETELVEQSFATRAQTLAEAAAEELLSAEEHNAAMLLLEQEKADQLAAIDENAAQKKKAVSMAVANTAMSLASMQLGQMASMMDQGNKKQFAAYKALAIVQTGISAVQAVMNALAVPPYPVGLALAVTAGAMGAANIAKLSSLEYQGGKATGGWVLPGRSVLVGEEGPELLTLGKDGGSITPNHKLGGGGSGGGRDINVTNVFQLSATGADALRAEVVRMLPMIGDYTKSSVKQAIAEGDSGFSGGR